MKVHMPRVWLQSSLALSFVFGVMLQSNSLIRETATSYAGMAKCGTFNTFFLDAVTDDVGLQRSLVGLRFVHIWRCVERRT